MLKRSDPGDPGFGQHCLQHPDALERAVWVDQDYFAHLTEKCPHFMGDLRQSLYAHVCTDLAIFTDHRHRVTQFYTCPECADREKI